MVGMQAQFNSVKNDSITIVCDCDSPTAGCVTNSNQMAAGCVTNSHKVEIVNEAGASSQDTEGKHTH